LPVRRALVAILAVPVLATVYLSLVLRRGPATRIALALVVGGAVVAGAVGVPAGTIGAPPATQAPLAASALGPVVATGRGLASALVVDFDAPMDEASVAAAIAIDPPAEIRLVWSDDGRRLAVEPLGRWRAATIYTVTVGTAARDRDGRALGAPLRAGFLTRAGTTATLDVVDTLPSGAALDTSIAISFDRPVPIEGVLGAFVISPAAAGEILVTTDEPADDDPTLADLFVWQPSELLASSTRYTVSLADGLVDADGAPVALAGPLSFTTTTAPSVVRFRPRSGTEDVARDALVSVRFTAPMDRGSTADAFSVEVNGTEVAGSVDFAEDDTVLVFDPRAIFPYGSTVILRVSRKALSAEGTPLDRPRAVEFSVEAEPEPEPTPEPRATPRPGGGGAAAPAPRPTVVPRPASSSWAGAEKYLLTLLNCMRSGGTVLSDGSCSGGGDSGIAPLAWHDGVADAVARPYAKKLAVSGVCSHFYGGTVGDRLSAAGYTGYQWAENLGCRYFADPRDAAESLVRFFRSSPGHNANMMSRKYTHAGIGLWVAGGNLRFVVVFYTP
jgi:uncharacterized protein YkwD